ncbi:MAG: ABC transporter permease [Hespellia sp.]|nr:ABC transporter permease [Hespellia sp.]
MNKKQNISYFLKKNGVLVGFILLFVVLFVISDTFRTAQNLINVLRQISINGIIAVGMTFVILTGGIDLCVGSLVAVAGVIAGSFITMHSELGIAALLLAICVCASFGLLNGILVSYAGVPPFIATLATMSIARGFAYVYSDGKPYTIASESFEIFGKGSLGPVPIPVVIYAVVVAAAFVLLNKTKFGRYLYATGGNENAAIASGVKTKGVKTWAYLCSGVLTGLAGVILASRIGSGQPAIAVGYETDAIAATVIGGTSLVGGIGTIHGTVIGVLLIGTLNNGMNLMGISSYYQQIVKGIIIICAVILDTKTKGKN